MRNTIIALAILLSFAGIQQACAQENDTQPLNTVSAGINSDAFTSLELGYGHSTETINHPVLYYIKFALPLISSIKQKRVDTWEVKLGAVVRLWQNDKYLLRSGIELFTIRHKQILGTFMPVGLNFKITPAYKTKNGYIGPQVKYNQVLFAHIKHSQYVKERFEEIYDADGQLIVTGPQDGTYLFTGSRVNIGAEGKFTLSNSLDMYFDLGWSHFISKYTKGFDTMMYGQVPFYLDLQMNYKLNKR